MKLPESHSVNSNFSKKLFLDHLQSNFVNERGDIVNAKSFRNEY